MTKTDMYCIGGLMLFVSFGFISFMGMTNHLDIEHIWHIIFGLLCINGIIVVLFGCGGDDNITTETKNRHWVWDKPPYEGCDPMDTAGHWEYDTNYHIKYKQ